MKLKLILSIAMVSLAMLSTCDIVYAGRPTPIVDTAKVNSLGALEKGVYGWKILATTTPDTLIASKPGSFVWVINHGSVGDTVLISYAQAGYIPQYASIVIGGHDARQIDFGENILKQIVIKAVSGSVYIEAAIKR